MGLEVAKKFAAKGANIVLVARNITKLEDAKKQVAAAAKNPSTQRFTWISADVTKPEENERLWKEAVEWNDGKLPDIVWQIAGWAKPDLFLDTPLDNMREHMEINYWAACYLAHTVLKAWTEEKAAASDSKSGDTALKVKEPLPRHFIMTASLAVYCGLAGYLPYSPAKAAMRNLADGLKSEMNLYNGARYHNLPRGSTPSQPEIKIQLTVPGTILSPGFEEEEKSKHQVTRILEDGDPKQLPEEVAEGMIKGLERGNYMTTSHFLGHAMRVSAINGAPRNGLFGIRDTLFSWATAVAWLFIGPDMERKVWNYGKEHGVQHRQK
jgi:3-dehydrosphinganine reductase